MNPILKKLFIPALIILLLIIGGVVYILIFKQPAEKPVVPSGEKTAEEILQSVTAPSTGGEISKTTIRSLTAPGKGSVSEDIIKSLTAPQ